MTNTLSALIVDPDPGLAERLEPGSGHPSGPIRLEFARNGKIAQLKICDESSRIAGIFINPLVQSTDFFSVLRTALRFRPATPIFLLLDENTPAPMRDMELQKLRIRAAIEKDSLSYRRIVELTAPLELAFDPNEALSRAEASSAGSERDHQDSSAATYSTVSATDFVSGSKSYFDVYIRIGIPGEERHIKLLEAGDSFTPERLERYLKRGVTQFYIRTDIQDTYLRYCDRLAAAVLRDSQLPDAIKVSQIRNQGEQVIEFFKANGLSDSNIRHASGFVNNVRALTQQLRLESDDAIKVFLTNMAAADHGAACTMIAGVLAGTMEISMDRPIQIVGTASMFQNMALYRMPEKLWSEETENMSSSERELFEQHPWMSAEILREVRGIDPAAIQAVEQHHQRRTGRGFPERNKLVPVNRVAEIVGISGEMYRVIKRRDSDQGVDVLRELEKSVFPQFSTQVVYATRSAFFPRAEVPAA